MKANQPGADVGPSEDGRFQRRCANCGEVFTPVRPQQKHCRPTCTRENERPAFDGVALGELFEET